MRTSVKVSQAAAAGVLWLIGAVSIGLLVVIVVYVLWQGLPHVTPGFLFRMPEDMGRAGGILPTLTTTLYVTALALLVAAPLGVGAALYLAEYTRENIITRVLRFGTETLAGVPSIIFGLFGTAFFVYGLRLRLSILSGSLTLALMLLPILVRTTEEAIKTVPGSYREGSLALGATKWQTVTRVVLPSAWGGILTGVLLGLGRAAGETAALWLTLGGSILRIPISPLEQGRTMTLHLYVLAMEGLSVERAFATAACLVAAILAVDTAAFALLRRFNRRRFGA
ncbi:MAG: phosphate ABC transporter permease PstA [Patescibacteria group bacterium]